MKIYFLIAFRNLVQAKRRTLLLGSAILFVSTLFLVLIGINQGAKDHLLDTSLALSSGHVNLGGFYKARPKASAPIIQDRQLALDIAHSVFPEAVRIVDRNRGWGRLVSPEASMNTGFNGINPEDEDEFFKALSDADPKEYLSAEQISKHPPRASAFRDLKNPNTILLFEAQAKKLGVGVGDTVTAIIEGGVSQANTLDLTVVGVAKNMGFMSGFNAICNRKTLLELYQMSPSLTSVVQIYLKDKDDSDKALLKLEKALKDKGLDVMEHDPRPFFMKFDAIAGQDWLGQKYDLTIWQDEVSSLMDLLNGLSFISFAVVMVMTFIISSGIANALWMSVRERIKEVGTIRAMGMKRRQVLMLFLIEGMLLGAISAVVGSLVAAVAAALINASHIPLPDPNLRLFLLSETLWLSLRPMNFLGVVALFTGVTALASLLPAWKASRLSPVVAMSSGK